MEHRDLQDFALRQAATLGIRATVVERDRWVPNLPGAEGFFLGILNQFEKDGYPIPMLLDDNCTLISSQYDGYLRCWDLTTGLLKWQSSERHLNKNRAFFFTISPDQKLIVSGQDGDENILLWEAAAGQLVLKIKGSESNKRFSWLPSVSSIIMTLHEKEKNVIEIDTSNWQLRTIPSPHNDSIQGIRSSVNSKYFATGDNSGLVCIWDAETKKCLHQHKPIDKVIWLIKWTPNNERLLVGYSTNTVLVIDAFTGENLFEKKFEKNETDAVSAIDFSPDGNYFAMGGRGADTGSFPLRIWDAKTFQEINYTSIRVPEFSRLQWSPNGAFIASGHQDGTLRFWDTRHLFPPQTTVIPTDSSPKTLSVDLQSLLSTSLQLHALGISVPLALLRDLLQLIGGQKVNSPLQDLATPLEPFVALRWPARARLGLVAWLLQGIPFPDWETPADCSLAQLEETLHNALLGETIEPELPVFPLARLREACENIDLRLLTLLDLLGPKAVAQDPGLPLRLSTQIDELPRLNTAQRRLLGLRVHLQGQAGQSTGHDPGADRGLVGGIELGGLRNDWRALLPSQLALPAAVFQYRNIRNELLYRARQVAEPPRLRPVVLLLDVSPATYGPVERLTRMAAYLIARTLYEAGLPAVLVTTPVKSGGQPLILELRHPADWVEIFTRRSLRPMNVSAGLQVAAALRLSLAGEGGAEPVVLLLTHAWFGAEESPKGFPGLRALFVQYPGQQVQPALAAICEKWERVGADQGRGLEQVLGRLIA